MAVPVLVGIVILIVLVKTRQAPEQAAPLERSRAVRVIPVPQVDLVPRVRGYGTVAPGRVWEAVAQVSGKIVETHPKLDEGQFLQAGAALLRIDPADYELEIAQIRGDVAATYAQLAELEVREQNTRHALAIEKESLQLSEKELRRKRDLVKKGTLPQSDADKEQRTVLAQRQSVTGQENTLRLLPVERQLLEAQLARYQAKLDAARLDLERTTVTLPFTARVAQVSVENYQYVRVGDTLVVADDISVAEVVVRISMQRFRNLIETRDEPIRNFPEEDLGALLGVSASVRLPEFDIDWPARLSRFSPTIDPDTRTIGGIVEVDEPYSQARPGIRPPLVKEMFVEVMLWGRPRRDARVVPRTAMHDGRVYLVNGDGRLEIRPVAIGLIQPELVSIRDGLETGEQVVISDLIPAIQGMRLEPHVDEEALARLVKLAQGPAQ